MAIMKRDIDMFMGMMGKYILAKNEDIREVLRDNGKNDRPEEEEGY